MSLSEELDPYKIWTFQYDNGSWNAYVKMGLHSNGATEEEAIVKLKAKLNEENT